MIEFTALLEYLQHTHFTSIAISAVLLVLYAIYMKAFKYYEPNDVVTWDERRSNRRRGIPPPSYPNGWFRVCQKKDLVKGESKFIKLNGRHLTVFRGEDNVAYALHAYCSHMGANLGIGGKVKWNSCIECPFHGWTFDGKSGLCVNSEHLDAKQCTHHEYNDIDNMTKDPNGKYISTCKTGTESKIQKFKVLEKNNLVYVWFHSRNAEPTYEPFEINDRNEYEDRGETTDYVCCQIQEIPENGADFKHFEYVHQSPSQILFPWVKFKWVPVDRKPTDKDFSEKMRNHPDEKIRKYANDLFDRFTNEKNKTHINNLMLDAYLVFFNRFEVYVQTAVVFQLGPGTVFLFLKFAFWDVIVVQSVTPMEKSKQIVHHKIYTKRWMPYVLSSQLLAGFRKQFISDKIVWNNKIFANKLTYNPKSDTDQRLLNWREWYSQYYEGCHEFEKQQDAYEW